MNQRRIVQQVPLTRRQRWFLCLAALPGTCIGVYISITTIVVLASIGAGFRSIHLNSQELVGLLLNLCLLMLALSADFSRTLQVTAIQALRDFYHGYAFTTTDRVVSLTDCGIEFAVAGLLHPLPENTDLPSHGHVYSVCYSPNTCTVWSIGPA